MKFLYLLFNLFALLPLGIYMWQRHREFFTRRLIWAVLANAFVFIIWDIWATAQGHWMFNHRYILGVTVFGLPIEELLFFITVPISCLGVWHIMARAIQNFSAYWAKYLSFSLKIFGFCSIAFGFFFASGQYTKVVLCISGAIMYWISVSSNIIGKKAYSFWLLTVYCLFLVSNWFLTAIPIVTYGTTHIFGLFVITIPIEDFFFNFAMLHGVLLLYETFD